MTAPHPGSADSLEVLAFKQKQSILPPQAPKCLLLSHSV